MNLNINSQNEWEIIPTNKNVLLQTSGHIITKNIKVGAITKEIVTDLFGGVATQSTLKIRIDDVPIEEHPNIKAILINKTTLAQYEGQFDYSDNTIIIRIDDFGTFDIIYECSIGAIIADNSINMNSPGQVYNISGRFSKGATYTAKIDLLNSNPLTSVTYLDAAIDMTKGSDEWDNMLIFKDIKPCVFKNGTVVYYLDRNDCTLKEDGTPAKLDGTDGDVMVEVPKFAYRIYKDTANGKNDMYVSVTTDPREISSDPRYHYYAFSKESEGDRNHFYWGAYKGSIDSTNTLCSVVGKAPAASQTIGNFKLRAQEKGSGYTITSYFQLVALQCLYIIKYGNLNGQAALGQGISGRSNTTSAANYGPLVTGGTTTFAAGRKMYYGSTSNTGSSENYEVAKLGHVKFAGIEDFWGNIWEWIDGLTTNSSRNIITNWDYDKKTEQANFTFTTGLTANKSGYVKDVAGTTEAGFMNTVHTGSATTYFCDNGALYAGCVLVFGGRWPNRAYCGPFCLIANTSASLASADIGARLMYL